jgi:hypothetical protein
MHNIPMSAVGPDFTIEAIHKIRGWIYERLRDATIQRQFGEIQRQAEPGIKTIGKLTWARKLK